MSSFAPSAARRTSVGTRLKRGLAGVLIVAYLATTAHYVVRQFLGDTRTSPFGQLFTWDMFPNASAHDFRRQAIGLTRKGHFVRLVPGPGERFRGGRDRTMARLDYLPDVTSPFSRGFFRQAVEDELVRCADAFRDDPITTVILAEGTWPVHFNLPDDWFQAEYGRPNPHRISWQVVDQATVSKEGRPNWRSRR